MAGYAVIALEGVMAEPCDELVTASPITQGGMIQLALSKYYKTVFLSFQPKQSVIEHWLVKNGIKGHTLVLPGTGMTGAVQRAHQLHELRRRGYHLELYIDASPAAVAAAMALGITSLLFASPAYARPEFRPDARTEIREWSSIEAEMHEQAALRGREPVPTADLEH